jgi:GntR family transcriptional regulator / MocR family aminotransferase
MSKRIASGIMPVIRIDRNAPVALHRQIYDAVRTAISEGHLRPGQQIPSSRLLANELDVSRLPVLNAYAQLLAEGYLTARIGAGTAVSSQLPDRFTSTAPMLKKRGVATHEGSRKVAQRTATLPSYLVMPWTRNWGAFGVGQVAADSFPLQTWSNIVARRSKNMSVRSFGYGDQMGYLPLRQSIAAYLRTARSVSCDADQILIVSGSQQALEISAQVLVDPGNSVWIEEPGYRFSREVFALAGSRLVAVPVDDEGLNVSAGIRKCRNARVAIVTPSHQFPLGVTMSASRRLQLLQWAQDNGSWIIEDDYDSEYRYESSPISSLQGLDSNERVIYIGTFSKVLFPSLRIGYIVVPRDLLSHFVATRRATDLGSPTLTQEVLAEFIGEGHFERHIRRMRVLYKERRSVLVESLRRDLDAACEVIGAEAGLHLTLTLPGPESDYDIALRAASQNLWLWPLSTAYIGGAARNGLILGFGSTHVADIPAAVRKLRGVLWNAGSSGA